MTTDTPTYPDVHVQLSGEDGNAFGIIGRAAKAIRAVHGDDAAASFRDAATDSHSYDELLQFVMSTVEVS